MRTAPAAISSPARSLPHFLLPSSSGHPHWRSKLGTQPCLPAKKLRTNMVSMPSYTSPFRFFSVASKPNFVVLGARKSLMNSRSVGGFFLGFKQSFNLFGVIDVVPRHH